jgi:NDP-sugar pyrophosphorylase family protein
MNLVIVSPGDSSRIRSEELKIPKHLIKINGECLIERIIRIAQQNGIQRIHFVINSFETGLKEFLLSNKFGISLDLIIQDTQNLMHSLFSIAPHLKKESFCFASIDSIFIENEFSEFIKYSLLHEDIDGTLAVTRYINDERPLCVAMDTEDTVLKFSDSKEGYNWATGGIYYFSPKIFSEIEFALESGISRLRIFLHMLIKRGYQLKGFSFSKIIYINYLSDKAKREAFLDGIKLC